MPGRRTQLCKRSSKKKKGGGHRAVTAHFFQNFMRCQKKVIELETEVRVKFSLVIFLFHESKIVIFLFHESKIVLSSSREQDIFEDVHASRPRT